MQQNIVRSCFARQHTILFNLILAIIITNKITWSIFAKWVVSLPLLLFHFFCSVNSILITLFFICFISFNPIFAIELIDKRKLNSIFRYFLFLPFCVMSVVVPYGTNKWNNFRRHPGANKPSTIVSRKEHKWRILIKLQTEQNFY